ncbi:MAG: ABC transporter permease subunit, partial [Planctomycetes bacterium]|nr:ABC transporter permease subunit [Planctomycetota bacterium]
MSTHIFLLELRMMARERAAWLLLALFVGALSYGYWNGHQLAKRNSETAETALQGSEELQRKIREHLSSPGKAIPVGGRGGIAMVGFLAQLPPAPLPVLATGQSDLVSASETVALMRLATPVDARSEIENPSHLLAGRFDLAFVLIWLYPLFLLAFLYDLMAGDRETGTLRLALSQGISPAGWLCRRTLARALPVVALALATTLLAGSDGYGLRLGAALAVILLYGLFWATLAVAINAVSSSAAGAATSLGAAWVAIVLVAPTLLNLAAESLYPTPSRPELVAASRQASGEAEKLGDELLDSFYKEHPELAPPDKRADYVAMKL